MSSLCGLKNAYCIPMNHSQCVKSTMTNFRNLSSHISCKMGSCLRVKKTKLLEGFLRMEPHTRINALTRHHVEDLRISIFSNAGDHQPDRTGRGKGVYKNLPAKGVICNYRKNNAPYKGHCSNKLKH